MHPTITRMQEVVAKGEEEAILELLAEDVTFLPPTYWKTWTGRAPVAAVLGHVGQIFSEFRYRRIMGEGKDLCKGEGEGEDKVMGDGKDLFQGEGEGKVMGVVGRHGVEDVEIPQGL